LSSYLFFCFPAGLLHPRLPSTFRFGIPSSNFLCSAHWNILTGMYVTGTTSLYSLTLLHCTAFSRRH
jgi:hypothetical protein